MLFHLERDLVHDAACIEHSYMCRLSIDQISESETVHTGLLCAKKYIYFINYQIGTKHKSFELECIDISNESSIYPIFIILYSCS